MFTSGTASTWFQFVWDQTRDIMVVLIGLNFARRQFNKRDCRAVQRIKQNGHISPERDKLILLTFRCLRWQQRTICPIVQPNDTLITISHWKARIVLLNTRQEKSQTDVPQYIPTDQSRREFCRANIRMNGRSRLSLL